MQIPEYDFSLLERNLDKSYPFLILHDCAWVPNKHPYCVGQVGPEQLLWASWAALETGNNFSSFINKFVRAEQ